MDCCRDEKPRAGQVAEGSAAKSGRGMQSAVSTTAKAGGLGFRVLGFRGLGLSF